MKCGDEELKISMSIMTLSLIASQKGIVKSRERHRRGECHQQLLKINRNDRRNPLVQDLWRRAATKSRMQGHSPKSSNRIVGSKAVNGPTIHIRPKAAKRPVNSYEAEGRIVVYYKNRAKIHSRPGSAERPNNLYRSEGRKAAYQDIWVNGHKWSMKGQ